MSKTRIYTVRDRDTGTIRLVEASTAAAARHHVTASRFDVDAASALDVARLMGDTGLKVEVAGQMVSETADEPDKRAALLPA